MKPKQIKKTLHLHELWLNGENGGKRANLQGADLQVANMRYANLWGADLQGANMRYADLQGAKMRYANLWGADLWGANLQGADLWGADLHGANLQVANMRYANLWGADLQGANIQVANLWGAVGNMREIKSLKIDTWPVTYTADTLQIGCQRHSIELWRKSDPRWIAAMDENASEWWSKFGPIILGLIDVSPATPTGKETK